LKAAWAEALAADQPVVLAHVRGPYGRPSGQK
jgi:hypothetical protein